MKNDNHFIFFLILLLIQLSSCYNSSEKCPKLKPIIYNDKECIIRYCNEEEYKNQICIISNDTAKTQWLNNILSYGDEEQFINNIAIINNYSEIIFSSYYDNEEKNSIIYYYTSDNQSNNKEFKTKIIHTTFDYNYILEFDIEAIKIEIKNMPDNYILSCFITYCDLINFSTNEVINIDAFESSYLKEGVSFRNSLFKLKNENNFFYSNLIKNKTTSKYYLSISSININFIEKNNTFNANVKINDINNETLIEQKIISCFQTDNGLIECMIVKFESTELFIFLFNNDLDFIQQIKIDKLSYYIYGKSINLQKEIGLYFYLYSNSEQPDLKIKNLTYSEKENKYLLLDVINTNVNLDINYYYSDSDYFVDYYGFDLFKISEKKFGVFNIIYNNMFVLALCEFYGKDDNSNNLIIRYYKIPYLLYNIKSPLNPKGFIFQNHLGISLINYIDNKPLIIIFGIDNDNESYSIVNITNINNLNNNFSLNYIINATNYMNNIKINNNIFGYEIFGMKIITLTGESSGIKYYINSNLGKDNKMIKENDIININDEIIIDYSNSTIKIEEENYLVMSLFFGDSEYDKYNSFADKVEVYGEEDHSKYFERQTYSGRSLKIKYNFGCHKNCDECEYIGFILDDQKCLSCKDPENFCQMKNTNNCFDINSLIYNFYNKSGNLICIPLNESCSDEYDYLFENKITKECKQTINFEDLLSDNYTIDNNKKTIDEVIKIFHEQIKNKTLNSTENIIVKGKNITFQLTDSEQQKNYTNNKLYNNISSIDLNECEEILKKEYGIDKLTILKIDIKRNDTPSTQVEYQVINSETDEILDLSKCVNVKINIYSPVDLEPEYLDEIIHLKKQGFDIFNSSDSFYNDICSTYTSENGTDVLLKDRKNDFYNPNITLCEESCEYQSFDVDTSKVNCECETKTEVNSDVSETSFNPNILIENFYSFEKYTNYKVLKCYELAFNSEKLKKNAGSYILIIISIIFIIIMSINLKNQDKKFEELFNKIINQNMNMEKKISRLENGDQKNKNNNSKNGTFIKQTENEEKKVDLSSIDNKRDEKIKEKPLHNPPHHQKNKDERRKSRNKGKNKRKSKSKSIDKDKKEYNQNHKDIHKIEEDKNKDSYIKNKYTNSHIKKINNIMSKKGSIITLDCSIILNSPENMNDNDNKFQYIETGLDSTINNNKIIKNIKENKNNTEKNKTKIADSNSSMKASDIFDLTYEKLHKKNKDNKNKKLKRLYTVFPINKSTNRKFDNSINEKNVAEGVIKNENKNYTQKSITKSKTFNVSNLNTDKISQNEIRITQIVNKIPKKERHQYFIDDELNTLEYKYAVNIDFRSFFQYYWSLLKQTHLIIFTFITKNDFNLFLLKCALFTMSLALNISMNALFFSDESMHKLYIDYGNFDFLYNLPQTIYSSLLSGFLSFLFERLSLSADILLKFKDKGYKNDAENKKVKEIKYLKLKSILFLIIGIILLLFFWYYLSCFCAVYYNTQIPLIKDTFITFSLGLLYPFPLTLIPTIVRIPALRKKSTCFYRVSRILTFVISLI